MPPVRKNIAAQPSRIVAKPGPAEVEEDQSSEVKSKADAFNNASPEKGFGFPVGNYTAHLVEAIREFFDGAKESIKFTYTVYEGEQEGKDVITWYNIFNVAGELQRGAGFFKRDMETLGQPAPDFEQIDEQLSALSSERLLCNITVKTKDGFTNVFLQGLAEGV